eukprot:Opistho-2@11275
MDDLSRKGAYTEQWVHLQQQQQQQHHHHQQQQQQQQPEHSSKESAIRSPPQALAGQSTEMNAQAAVMAMMHQQQTPGMSQFVYPQNLTPLAYNVTPQQYQALQQQQQQQQHREAYNPRRRKHSLLRRLLRMPPRRPCL